MDYEELRQMTQVKDKSKASKTDKQAFTEAWIAFAQEQGPSPEVFSLMVAGFGFNDMVPFSRWLRKVDDRQKMVLALVQSEAFGKNRSISFKMGLNLLARLLVDFREDLASAAVLMRILPQYSLTKEKTLLNDFDKSFNKYFCQEVYVLDKLHALGKYQLNDKDLKAFRELLAVGVMPLQPENADEHQLKTAKLLQYWLSDNTDAEPDATVQPAKESSEGQPDNKETVPVKPVEPAVKPVPETEYNPYTDFTRGMLSLKNAFSSVSSSLSALQQECRTLRNQNEVMKAEKAAFAQEIQTMAGRIKELSAALDEKENQVFAFQSDISYLQDQIEQKEKELADRIQLNEMIVTDNVRQADQKLKRMGNELKTFYEDIMACRNVPMTVDLGEVLLIQINDVFSILRENGITMD